MRYVLDTKIVANLIRHPQGRVAKRIREVGEAQVCTSIIVAAELRYGVAKQGSPRLRARVEAVIDAFEVLPFEVAGRRRLRSAPHPAGKGPVSRSAGMTS
jgi:tRNA(fMet)-specific endonuclease VapC